MGRKTRGYFRTVLDLAEAMEEVLGDKCCAYTEAEISEELKKIKSGIQYYTTEFEDGGVAHIGLSSVIRNGRPALNEHTLYGTWVRRRGT